MTTVEQDSDIAQKWMKRKKRKLDRFRNLIDISIAVGEINEPPSE